MIHRSSVAILIVFCAGWLGYRTRTSLALEPPAARSGDRAVASNPKFPDLPDGLTSFGAAVAGGRLWIYGGHQGEAHRYWSGSQSNRLWSLDLVAPQSWDVIERGPRLQGLALVAHGDHIYRVGGMAARNAEGAEQDLWSTDEFARWNTDSRQWEPLVPLPEPRSSHDALVIGDRLYVVGGWTLRGAAESIWLETAYVLDFSQTPLHWQALAKPPFQRRALSLGFQGGRLLALGGMPAKGPPTRAVDVLQIDTGTWSRGPELLGMDPMEGFGTAAAEFDSRLYVSTYSGKLQRLNADGDGWEIVGQLPEGRFFHRLVPVDGSHLAVVGGANMSSGKITNVEVLTPK